MFSLILDREVLRFLLHSYVINNSETTAIISAFVSLEHLVLPTNRDKAKRITIQEDHYCVIRDIWFRIPRPNDKYYNLLFSGWCHHVSRWFSDHPLDVEVIHMMGWTHCSRLPEYIVATKPDKSVLIAIIQFSSKHYVRQTAANLIISVFSTYNNANIVFEARVIIRATPIVTLRGAS